MVIECVSERARRKLVPTHQSIPVRGLSSGSSHHGAESTGVRFSGLFCGRGRQVTHQDEDGKIKCWVGVQLEASGGKRREETKLWLSRVGLNTQWRVHLCQMAGLWETTLSLTPSYLFSPTTRGENAWMWSKRLFRVRTPGLQSASADT